MNRSQSLIPSEILRERLRELRTALGLSQRELGEIAAGLGGPPIKSAQPAIARIEAGTRSVDIDEAYALAAALGVELDYLTNPEPHRPTWTDYLVQQAERSPEEVATEGLRPTRPKGGRMTPTAVIEERKERRSQIKDLEENIEVCKQFIQEVSDEEPLTAEEERLYMERLKGRLEALREMELSV